MLWWESCSGEEARVEKARDLPGGEPVLRARGIDKSFGAVRVLESVDFEVRPGEVVALIGDNGAGKSTLINVLTGVLRPDSGEIFFEEKRVRFATPHEARERGIETVYQDLAVAPQLDAVSNIFLGREHRRAGILGRLGFLDGGRMRRETEDQLTDLRVRLSSLEKPLSTLSGGQRQGVAVARAVMWASKVVIMDEPTAALGVAQVEMVLDLIRRVRDTGIPVVFISHNMPHVFEVADRISVLRLGEMVAELDPATATTDDAVAAMTGSASGNGEAA
ncbi:MAG: sugar ABC transporter ATP-binding protein [Rubrobacter sp.]|jgi:ABC-type sugar transport system ATPase subunit|nr:sugar ABC transporter ATP-binding protein [Rubrobacter sp.]